MPPVFKESNFEFIEGESAPEHIESWPTGEDRLGHLWHVNAHDAFDNEIYTVVSNSISLEEAELLAEAFRRRLEKSQADNHDIVFVIGPGDMRNILLGNAES